VLSSGSRGNAALVRAGDTSLLIDAGLPLEELDQRFESARFAPSQLDHVFVTHGHLDHARSAGRIARRERATLHCAQAVMRNGSIRRCKRLATLAIGHATPVQGRAGDDDVRITPVILPHDADPTVAFRVEHGERCAAIATDFGTPRDEVARALRGAHVLVLEFNHDEGMLHSGPYPPALRRRIAGGGGHLSNAQSARMLIAMAGPNLHTLVLAHLSEVNNTPERALEAAHGALAILGMTHVQVLVARQDEIGPNLAV
jgi:phosphoribosyl 1,2-cyclic phosphodiesterase